MAEGAPISPPLSIPLRPAGPGHYPTPPRRTTPLPSPALPTVFSAANRLPISSFIASTSKPPSPADLTCGNSGTTTAEPPPSPMHLRQCRLPGSPPSSRRVAFPATLTTSRAPETVTSPCMLVKRGKEVLRRGLHVEGGGRKLEMETLMAD